MRNPFPRTIAAGLSLAALTFAHAQEIDVDPAGTFSTLPETTLVVPSYVIPGKSEFSTLYFDGSQIQIETFERWKFICTSDLTGLTSEDLRRLADEHYRLMEEGPVVVIDGGTRQAGINIIYNADGSVPANALSGFALAEAYLETQFGDDITVRVNCSFANMGSGVIGATGSNYASNVTWNNSRDALQSDMDSDDVIQTWLPTGSTIPVRYNGNNATVTNENSINWTIANYRAAVGTVSGTAGNMTYNNQFTFDWDPSDGVPGGRISFVDVVIHETGHALGFTSAADFSTAQMEAMDIYRFQRTDGSGDFNPDTFAEFQTTARLVDNNTPNDDHNSDIIDRTHRMSDGSPYQASHLREQSPALGIMDPAFAGGQTFYPNYFRTPDLDIFDAMGYDYPPAPDCFEITSQPMNASGCEGDQVQLSVASTAIAPTYQWRIGTTNLSDALGFSGSQSATLTILSMGPAFVGADYNCLITDTAQGDCEIASANAEVTLDTSAPDITGQPANVTVTEGGFVSFNVTVTDPFNYTYQWRFNGANLTNNVRISGATNPTLGIDPVELGDAGDYDCVITPIFGACVGTSNAATLTVNPDTGGCPEDLNGDNVIDLADLSVLLAHFGEAGADPEHGDVDGDGDVDLADLSQVLAVFGTTCP